MVIWVISFSRVNLFDTSSSVKSITQIVRRSVSRPRAILEPTAISQNLTSNGNRWNPQIGFSNFARLATRCSCSRSISLTVCGLSWKVGACPHIYKSPSRLRTAVHHTPHETRQTTKSRRSLGVANSGTPLFRLHMKSSWPCELNPHP